MHLIHWITSWHLSILPIRVLNLLHPPTALPHLPSNSRPFSLQRYISALRLGAMNRNLAESLINARRTNNHRRHYQTALAPRDKASCRALTYVIEHGQRSSGRGTMVLCLRNT